MCPMSRCCLCRHMHTCHMYIHPPMPHIQMFSVVYPHTHIHPLTHTHMHIYVRTCIHTYMRTHAYIHTYIQTYIYTHTHLCSKSFILRERGYRFYQMGVTTSLIKHFIHNDTHMHTHTHTHTHTCTHIHTHTYTHKFSTCLFSNISRSLALSVMKPRMH